MDICTIGIIKRLKNIVNSKQNSFSTGSCKDTTDDYGFIDSKISFASTSIVCANVDSTAGYIAIPLKKGTTWQFLILAVGNAASAANSRYAIAIGNTEFTVSYVATT